MRAAAITMVGFKVFAPVKKRKDGGWSANHRIIAMFLREREAKKYAGEMRRMDVPAYVIGPKEGEDE